MRFRHFDLILLDVMFPKMDGYKICKTLRSQKRHVSQSGKRLDYRSSPCG
jgi:CheY-like chemotaxis protein